MRAAYLEGLEILGGPQKYVLGCLSIPGSLPLNNITNNSPSELCPLAWKFKN